MRLLLTKIFYYITNKWQHTQLSYLSLVTGQIDCNECQLFSEWFKCCQFHLLSTCILYYILIKYMKLYSSVTHYEKTSVSYNVLNSTFLFNNCFSHSDNFGSLQYSKKHPWEQKYWVARKVFFSKFPPPSHVLWTSFSRTCKKHSMNIGPQQDGRQQNVDGPLDSFSISLSGNCKSSEVFVDSWSKVVEGM